MCSVSDTGWRKAMLISLISLTAILLPYQGLTMTAMDDSALAGITGQNGSLFLADHIGPNELEGAPGDGTANFDFYRMGLDAKLNLNLNISKFQVGCGGVNDLLTTSPGCDLDIDYLGFMGINAAGNRPAYNADNADAEGNWGPESAFELIRPYMELAIKNDDNPTLREVVGIKLGAETINGALRMGRDYLNKDYPNEVGSGAANIINQEHGSTCNPSATTGAGVVGCHSGLNSISGYLPGLELSAGFKAQARVCTTPPCFFGIGEFDIDLDGCIGRINFGPCSSSDTPFFIDAGGTRLDSLYVAAAALNLRTQPISIDVTGYGSLELDTRQIHYLLTPNSSGFFLSLQREPVSWPHYEKSTPASRLEPGTFNACDPAYGQVTARCGSAYAPRANTGWWLSAANAKVLDLRPDDRIVLPGTFQLWDLIAALGPNNSPIHIDNPKLDFVAAQNCYGSARFC